MYHSLSLEMLSFLTLLLVLRSWRSHASIPEHSIMVFDTTNNLRVAIFFPACIYKPVPHQLIGEPWGEENLNLCQGSQDMEAVLRLFSGLTVKQHEFVQTDYPSSISMFPCINEIESKESHPKCSSGIVLYSVTPCTIRCFWRGTVLVTGCFSFWCLMRFFFEAYFLRHIWQMKPDVSLVSSTFDGRAILSTNWCMIIDAYACIHRGTEDRNWEL